MEFGKGLDVEVGIETCKEIIGQNGSCVDVDCDDCPGSYKYNDDVLCQINGWKIEAVSEPCVTCVENAQAYIDYHTKEKEMKEMEEIKIGDVWVSKGLPDMKRTIKGIGDVAVLVGYTDRYVNSDYREGSFSKDLLLKDYILIERDGEPINQHKDPVVKYINEYMDTEGVFELPDCHGYEVVSLINNEEPVIIEGKEYDTIMVKGDMGNWVGYGHWNDGIKEN